MCIYSRLTISLNMRCKWFYLKNKVTQMKRKAGIIKTALVDTKSKMEFLSTVVMLDLSYACKALFDNKEEIGNHLRSAIYQCTKTMFGIRGNVKINNVLDVLRINPTIEHKILKRGIITDYLSQKVIKLRIGWLFSWRYKRLCNCSHMINFSNIITKWNKLKSGNRNGEKIINP